MKFVFSFMVCSAIAASVMMHNVDLNKCSVEYIRHLVQQSCIRLARERRHVTENVHGDFDTPHRFGRNQQKLLPRIPHHVLPPNVTLVAMRKPKHVTKRDTAAVNDDIYFKYCCDFMYQCENMDCPF